MVITYRCPVTAKESVITEGKEYLGVFSSKEDDFQAFVNKESECLTPKVLYGVDYHECLSSASI